MDLTAGSLWPDQEPSMGWHLVFFEDLEEVPLEVFWCLVVLLHHVSLGVLLEAALEQVERAVVAAIEDILYVLVQGHFELAAAV